MNVNENILLYDVFDDNKNVLNSQVILDNYIGFEIPKNYYFNKESTDLKNHILHIKSDKDFIRLYYEKCNEYSYKEKIEEIERKYKTTEDFINYRGQRIIEYENETGINVISYDGAYVLILNSKCKKYSYEYYILYFIVFSFDSDCPESYDNSYYQKNSYCILKNGKYVYDKYKINLIKYNPSESLDIINTESFCKFISDNIEYDEKLDNYYVEKTKINQNIVNRINNYHNNENDDPSLMDLIEE